MIETQRAMRLLLLICLVACSAPLFANEPLDPKYFGNYRISGEGVIGIDPFISDSGEKVVLFSDYATGVVRRLFRVSDSEFAMGPAFNTQSPRELTVRFVKNDDGSVKGVALETVGQTSTFARPIARATEEVAFNGADARLAGTLIKPTTQGPHPAIVLLHGSGPLTRYSFGPYPHFFSSLGLAVLIFDKRGTGDSTGVRMDASTATVQRPAAYPEDLANDALAAVHMLAQRDDIDAKRIGVWGSSEGGMLVTQVAARSKDVAFAINSSGFMEPLWQTLQFQVNPTLKNMGVSAASIKRHEDFVDLWLRVARTGEGWEQFQAQEKEIVAKSGTWFFATRGKYESLEQLRHDWNRILTFDPRAALGQVTCPILAVFGEMDTATPAKRTAENMRRVLTRAGHPDFTIKIFPNAGHSLSEVPSKSRMAPGVFDTLRAWLIERKFANERAGS